MQVNRRSGLGLLTLCRTEKRGDFTEKQASDDFEMTLLQIQNATGRRAGGVLYARGFSLFERDRLHILKPLTLRHWTRTAALNDADALMGFMATGSVTDAEGVADVNGS